ncbi:MAG: cysteine protease StiP family protein [Methylobacter sp.]|nr:cysteine protease StiP family protein [Methylobacter sp.]MDP2429316.1 cysteine protease StiP family protein [Methylobacter sp.]MDP3056274.1 cysteine protease StiP family protein [Methylobacter sp.]MDP3360528.1 cysteine protease StiP family protein [Methylobacter sp.]MDZ4221149.1 cysteine protease StiP family protein [Methylobacter sp.]
MSFHGSYRPLDVEFLLKPIKMDMIDTPMDKERLIQSGLRHYSEMLSPEKIPSPKYRELFFQAHELNKRQMAKDCLHLARLIMARTQEMPTLVSLARAGTPVGAVLAHILRQLSGQAIAHFSVSIIRDRGIDAVALDHILAQGYKAESIVFIDGWTGKGVISRELDSAIAAYNRERGTHIDSGLYVLADLAGTAACAASGEDYLIPSSILNSTISGLVSRTILNSAVGADDFHGCVHFKEFAGHDLSCWFVDDLVKTAFEIDAIEDIIPPTPVDRAALADISRRFMRDEMQRHRISDENLIKPGIGEATRVLLRRVPKCVMVRDADAASVAHLIALAKEKNIPVEKRPDLPYNAASIIRSLKDA